MKVTAPMKLALKAALVATALSLAVPVAARTMRIRVHLKRYSGRRAYLAVYITDRRGRYVTTAYAAGRHTRFFEHLRRWYSMVRRSHRGIDGSTGASVGSGRSFSTAFNIPSKMLNSGYKLKIESAVEGHWYYSRDVTIPLSSRYNGKYVRGHGYVKTAIVKF